MGSDGLCPTRITFAAAEASAPAWRPGSRVTQLTAPCRARDVGGVPDADVRGA